jgi:excinuclease ABC subunit C
LKYIDLIERRKKRERILREHVKKLIARAPVAPGVYIFRDERGRALYVGKAVRLRDRLRSYANPLSDKRPSVALMVPLIDHVEWLLADNEKEALILENNLIKSYRPKYNIMYRDDKSYLSIKMTNHAFPRIYRTRKIVQDGSTYFGPFSSVASVNRTLKLLQKIFQVRDCTDHFFNNRSRPCLRHQIKLCSAPCVGKITQDDYMEQVLQIKDFMKGRTNDLLKKIKTQMNEASQAMNYEKAALLRDQVQAMEETLKPQTAESREHFGKFVDVVGMTGDAQATLIKLLKIRSGKMVGADEYYLDEPIAYAQEIVRSFLQQYYLEDLTKTDIPQTIIIPEKFEDADAMEGLLSERLGLKVRFVVPQRGQNKKYLDLADRNAKTVFLEQKRRSQKTIQTLEKLQILLKLPTLPTRIEGYDISNFQGSHSYGSMVVFTDGEKDAGQYRIYSIQTVTGPDDFASMKEVLTRRLKRLEQIPAPDLLLIDGGRGQLSQVVDVLHDMNLSIPVVSIAKEKELKSRSGTTYAPERLYLPGQKNPIVLPKSSPMLHLLQRVRDEAHRFGLSHHRKKRSKKTIASQLKNIPGIGPTRQKALLRHFGSVQQIQQASLKDLAHAPKMNDKSAKAVKAFFNKQSS